MALWKVREFVDKYFVPNFFPTLKLSQAGKCPEHSIQGIGDDSFRAIRDGLRRPCYEIRSAPVSLS
jgi:hypothetical protein